MRSLYSMIALAAVLVVSVGLAEPLRGPSGTLPYQGDPPSAESVTGFPEIDPKTWVTTGARVPSIELPRIDGQGSINLADLRGRKLLLIHFASW